MKIQFCSEDLQPNPNRKQDQEHSNPEFFPTMCRFLKRHAHLTLKYCAVIWNCCSSLPTVSGSRYKTGHGNMSAHNFDRARWDVAGKVIRQMHELRQKIEEQDISDIQLKKEYENVFIRALSWAQNLRGWCLQELSHDTNVLLNTMITSMEESEQQSLGEGNQMLQTVKDDLHEIEKRIQSICRMQGVSVTLGNPFVVRVAGTIT